MEPVKDIAAYLCRRYQRDFGQYIDEMKLHKLLYFAQREALIVTDAPLFAEEFQAWRYGPVMVPVRQLYRNGSLRQAAKARDITAYAPIFDYIFATYATKDSWSLSAITHGEYSWRKARCGCAPTDPCGASIPTADIRVDAIRVKERRQLLRAIAKIRTGATRPSR